MYFLGVESAESETRVIVVDLQNATVVASGSAAHRLVEGVPIGSQERVSSLWITALNDRQSNVDRAPLKGGASGVAFGYHRMADYSVLADDSSWCGSREESHEFYLEQLSKQQYRAEPLIGAEFLV